MPNTERFQAVIEVNQKQAMDSVKQLEAELDKEAKKLSDMKQRSSEFTKEQIRSQELLVKARTDALTKERRHVKGLSSAMETLTNKNYKGLKAEVKALNRLLMDGTVAKNSKEWNALAERIKAAKAEMKSYNDAVQLHEKQPMLKRFIMGMNENWGAITQGLGLLTGLQYTIRKVVSEYASMEEAMADTRKYTGLTDQAIRELNEDLKKIDTRTGREELNALAGAAGRLGKTSKQDILDFVEAGNMIKVALGDDLGEGAIDKVGKLAMAFGEDEKMGLRGAMLATGSAVNELAQNSSAQAGYLVDFTARVAGFGKQLGLTQAQIMGFGAVMDENLLRDEMAATAFGNMLTKMQTDTAKFARIAGMDIKSFTDLLNKDANGAILALADNIRKADPQNMMKMLDDMGLDGSRAVGVLSTLADKIDDVRARQNLATKAYQEGVSIQKEYATMNNTVEASIEKAKKQFAEMSVELGEKLMPIVKYAITGSSILVRTLSVLTSFIINHQKAIVKLAAIITALTVVYKAAEIQAYAWYAKEVLLGKIQAAKAVVMKTATMATAAYNVVVALLTGNVTRATAAMRLMRIEGLKNPYTALATAILAVGVAVYEGINAWRRHKQAVHDNLIEVKKLRAEQALQADLNKQVADSNAAMKTKIEQLTRIIHSNAYSINERKNAIKTMQSIIPDYHASISKEGRLFGENSQAIKQYIEDLDSAALAEALYQRKVEINKKKTDLSYREERIRGSIKAVDAYREQHRDEMTETKMIRGVNGRQTASFKETDAGKENTRQRQVHEQRLANVESEKKVVEAEDKYIEKVLSKNKKLQTLYNNKVTSDTASPQKHTGNTTPYVSEAEQKKKQAEAEKAETERLKKLREADRKEKAITDAKLADNILKYQAGLQTYREYVAEQQRIQEEGLKARMNVWDKESAEYAKYQKQLAALQLSGDNEQTKLKLKDIEHDHAIMMSKLEEDYLDQNSSVYMNDEQLHERRFLEEMRFLQQKKSLTRKGSLEEMQLEWEIKDRENAHKMEKEREYAERLMQYRQDVGKMNYDQLMDLELKGLETMYSMLHAQGKMTEQEYLDIIQNIKNKYAGLKAEQTAGNDIEAKGASALDTAKKGAGVKSYDAGDNAVMGVASITNAISNQQKVNAELKRLRDEDAISEQEYQEAKRQMQNETMQQMVAGAQAAYSSISSFMSAASSYAQACSDLEVAKITQNYDAQIAAAGKNEKKKEKLEKEKEKAIAKAKSDGNKKAMKMEIAQAIASTAMAAINAYASAAQVPFIGYLLAPIAAGMAVAAGALQIATIKKQHEAQAAGYYEGGFTKGKRYKKEAGVVHEGEFVANHQAVNNPNVLPMLQFLDQAQRNNTVGSLTAEDVSRVAGGAGSAVVAPVVNVQSDNAELRDTLDRTNDVIDRMEERLSHDIHAYVTIAGPDGVKKGLDDYDKLMKNK